MQDPLIEVILSHKPEAISEEQFAHWRQSPVTRQLYYDISLEIIETLADTIPKMPIAEIGARAAAIEAARIAVLSVLDWNPTGGEE